MIAAVQLINSVMNPLNYLTNSLASYKSAKNIVEKFEETLETVKQGNEVPSDFRNTIEISNLSFSYGLDHPVLKDIDLTLPRGKKIALIGPSGCGKSTLAKILAREISGFEGSITLEGIPIEDIDIGRYREMVRFIRQDPFIFTDTVRENITFFEPNYDDSNFESALRLSKVDNFAALFSELDRIISNTSGLSGDQKQRVIIARALLRNSPILILDKLTSALGLDIVQKIIQDVLQIKDITCIVITHQYDDKNLAMFDSVIKLNDVNMI